jgi:hypothetical protein
VHQVGDQPRLYYDVRLTNHQKKTDLCLTCYIVIHCYALSLITFPSHCAVHNFYSSNTVIKSNKNKEVNSVNNRSGFQDQKRPSYTVIQRA